MSKREKIVLQLTLIKVRNPLTLNPLMKKGGVHLKSKGAERNAVKRQLQKSLDDMRGSSVFTLPFSA